MTLQVKTSSYQDGEQKIIITAGTPITQFLPGGGVEVREFTPEVVDALKDIKIKGVRVVDVVVAKLLSKSPSFVRDFSHPKESPNRERVPGYALENSVQVTVIDGRLKVMEIIPTGGEGPSVGIEL